MANKPRHYVEERREKVKELYYFGNRTVKQIVKDLKNEWHEKVIYSDVQILEGRLNKVVKDQDLAALVRRRFLFFYRNIASQYKNYSKAAELPLRDQVSLRSIISKRIEEMQSTFIKDLQELGIVLKPEETVHLSVSEGIERGYAEATRRAKELHALAIDRVKEARKKRKEKVVNE